MRSGCSIRRSNPTGLGKIICIGLLPWLSTGLGFGPIFELGYSVGGTVIVLNQAALNILVEEAVGLLLWKPRILNPIARKL